jgi:hypothetical protein
MSVRNIPASATHGAIVLSSAGELPDVRYGLLADIGQPIRDVRFAARGDDVRAIRPKPV